MTQVLLLEGMGESDGPAESDYWYSQCILGKGSRSRPSENPGLSARWAPFKVHRVNAGFHRQDERNYKWDVANGIYEGGKFAGEAKMKSEIMSGRYSTVVVSDLSYGAAMKWFANELGETVKTFVSGGGKIIFPTTEGLQLCPVLGRLFDTPWTGSAYYRTTWAARPESAELISTFFPGFDPGRHYSAKACSLKNVPFEDRVLGVTSNSRHESLSMRMHGATDAGPKEAESVAELDGELDYDVMAATRPFGRGRIAYVGDVNCDDGTPELVLAFCSGRSGGVDSAADLSELFALPAAEYEDALRLKAKGNDAFGDSNFELAKASYGRALEVFGDRPGSGGAQRDDKGTILSNMAEACLRLNDHAGAEAAAAAALEADRTNSKARLRRVKALVGLGSLSDAMAELTMLELVSPEVVGTKQFKIMNATIKSAIKAAKRKAGAGLRQAFAAGGEGLLGGSTPAAQQATTTENGANSGWATGLSVPDRYEWFCNCYQMRCDDDYVYGGCYLHGPYDSEATGKSIADDFLVFCLLARRSGALPAGWDWAACLKAAAKFVCFAFEKSDAQERWGSENVFSAAMGGRSLRYTGEQIYSKGVQYGEDTSEEEVQAQEDARAWAEREDKAVVSPVGGAEAWTTLATALLAKRPDIY